MLKKIGATMYLPMPTPGWVAFTEGSETASRVDADEVLLEFIGLHNRHVRKEPMINDFAKKYGRLGVPVGFTRTFRAPEELLMWGLTCSDQAVLTNSVVTMEDERWWHASISTLGNVSDLSYIASLGIAAQNMPAFRRAASNNFMFREGPDGPECVYHADTGLACPFPGSADMMGRELADALDHPFAASVPLAKMPDSDLEKRRVVAENAGVLVAGFARFYLAPSDEGSQTLIDRMKSAMAKRVEEDNGFGVCLYCGRPVDLSLARKKTRKFLCDQRCTTAFHRQMAQIYQELYDCYGYTVDDLKSVGLGRSEEELEALLQRG